MHGIRVFDDEGNEVWTYGRNSVGFGNIFKEDDESSGDYEKSPQVLQAAVGDLNNDGISEFLVATKNEGIRAFDQKGVQLWFIPKNFRITH